MTINPTGIPSGEAFGTPIVAVHGGGTGFVQVVGTGAGHAPIDAGTSGSPSGFDQSDLWHSIERPQALQWLAVDLLSGAIICEMPTLVSTDPFRRTIGRYESAAIRFAVAASIDPSWVAGTRPFSSALIAIRGLPGEETIHWGGVVLRRTRTLGSNIVELTLATPECYFDRRYTGAYTTDPLGVAAKVDQNVVVEALIDQFVTAAQGLPMTVQVVGSAGTPILAVFNDYDDKTVYSNLTTMMAQLDGPEWSAHWTWNRATNTIRPVVLVGNRLGIAATTELGPAAVFDSAVLLDASMLEDYSNGSGANDVTAIGQGSGLARPLGEAVQPNFGGRPRAQYRYSPSTSAIEDVLTLQGHATRALGILQNGTTTLTLKAAAGAGPQLGVDWDMGDDIGYDFTGPAFPGGMTGVQRCVSYETTDSTTSPILYLPAVI